MSDDKPRVYGFVPKDGKKLYGAIVHMVPELDQGAGLSVPCLGEYELWTSSKTDEDLSYPCPEKEKYHVHLITYQVGQGPFILRVPIYSVFFLRQSLHFLEENRKIYPEVSQNLLRREEGRACKLLNQREFAPQEEQIMGSENFYKLMMPMSLK